MKIFFVLCEQNLRVIFLVSKSCIFIFDKIKIAKVIKISR